MIDSNTEQRNKKALSSSVSSVVTVINKRKTTNPKIYGSRVLIKGKEMDLHLCHYTIKLLVIVDWYLLRTLVSLTHFQKYILIDNDNGVMK